MSARPSTPPPLPSEVLVRTIRLSNTKGRVVLWLSGVFALVAAAGHDAIGAAAGCAAAGAGAIELHGSGLLRKEEARGVDWLIRGQLLLLAIILIYAAMRLTHFDPEALRERITPEINERLGQVGMTHDQFLDACRTLYQIFYAMLGFVALFYQGTMARYYARRRVIIHQALKEQSESTI